MILNFNNNFKLCDFGFANQKDKISNLFLVTNLQFLLMSQKIHYKDVDAISLRDYNKITKINFKIISVK